MPKPFLASHRGKLVEIWPDGQRTDAQTGQKISDEPEPPRIEPPKRWHDPYR